MKRIGYAVVETNIPPRWLLKAFRPRIDCDLVCTARFERRRFRPHRGGQARRRTVRGDRNRGTTQVRVNSSELDHAQQVIQSDSSIVTLKKIRLARIRPAMCAHNFFPH